MDEFFYRRCAQDRDLLLARVRHEVPIHPPGRALLRVAELLGLRVAGPNPSADEARAALAHRLGHQRLHGEGPWSPDQQQEAATYARVFLLPRRGILGCPRLAPILNAHGGRQRWEAVTAMAAAWWVPPAMLTARLRELGVPGLGPSDGLKRPVQEC
ncbi:MAG: hypothetical protein AB1758_19860 [Candidatus Eremiobacterota bacterium]